MANIGTLAISVVAKTDKFERRIKGAKSKWLSFVKGFASSTAIIGAMTAISRAVSEAANRIDDLAKSGRALGVTYQEMRRLSIVAKMSGIEVSTLSTGMRALSVHVLNARRGLASSVDLFNRIGINVSELEGMSMPDIMERVARSINATADPAERLALAAQLLGRQGAAIAAAADGLNAANAAAMRVSDSLGEDQVRAIERANDAWTELIESINIYTNVSAAAASKAKGELFSGLANFIQQLDKKGAIHYAHPLLGTFRFLDDFFVGASRISAEAHEEMIRDNERWIQSWRDRIQRSEEILSGLNVVDWAEESGVDYAKSFEDALTHEFAKADWFDSFAATMQEGLREGIRIEMDAVEAQLNALSQEADRIRASARPRMSAGVQAKTSGFDIRGLMIGGGVSSTEQKQLDELEDQSKILQRIYRRLGNQAAMVGA